MNKTGKQSGRGRAARGGEVVRCVGCRYWRPLSYHGGGRMRACHFCLDTGELRGMAARECYLHEGTRYVPGNKWEAL